MGLVQNQIISLAYWLGKLFDLAQNEGEIIL